MTYITLTKDNLDSEHICCAFSDKKCTESYEKKKDWLRQEFENGHVFYRLDERAKVFIEFGPIENAWVPVRADNYMFIGCFWVSGKYKGNGHGKALLGKVMEDAKKEGRAGLVTITGTKKVNFMGDGKWFLKQGFETCDTTGSGFSLLVRKFSEDSPDPQFRDIARTGECENKNGFTAYYTNRCPFSEYHVETSLVETAVNRKIPLKIIKLESLPAAQNAPTPATIFSLFYKGKFITSDISACMDSKFEKFIIRY